MIKSRVNIIKIIKVTPGKNHYWVLSDMGIIRKPVNVVRAMFVKNSEIVKEDKISWFNRFLVWIIKKIDRFLDGLFF